MALAKPDFLANWHNELLMTLIILAGLLAVAALLGATTLRLARSGETAVLHTAQDKAFMASVLDSLSEQIAVIDADGVILKVNATWCQFALQNGLAQPEQVGVGVNYLAACSAAFDSPEGEDAFKVYHGVQAVLSGQQGSFTLEYPCHSPAVQRWFVLRVLPLVGGRSGAVLIHQDVSERYRAQTLLQASEERFRLLFDTSIDGILLTAPDGRIFAANRSACLMLQRREAEIRHLGRSGIVDTQDPRLAMSLEARRCNGQSAGELTFIRKDGSQFPCDVSSTIYQNSQGEVRSSVVFRDITERKLEAARMHDFAFHDALTRLPNRRLLSDRIQQATVAGKRSGLFAALMYLDLDNFKPLNDQHGHDVGDLLLIDVAQRLQQCVRQIDTVARVGGDEFVVLLSELHVQRPEAAQLAQALAEKIASSLALPYSLSVEDQSSTNRVVEHCCTASIGVLLFLGDALTVHELLARVDAAMYQAKHAGHNGVHFDPGAGV